MNARKRKQIPSLFSRWHRRLGITAAIFVILLSGTGMMLQHAPSFGLDQTPLGSTIVARWMGMEPPSVTAYSVESNWLLATRESLWLGDRRIDRGHYDSPRGVVRTVFGFAVVTSEGHVILFDDSGQRIEQMRPETGLPASVDRIGRGSEHRIIIESEGKRWRAGKQWLGFEAHGGDSVEWSQPQPPPNPLRKAVQQQALADSVTWERFLLVLHSGRIAGAVGVFLMDAAAIVFIVLAATGVYLWWRRR